MLSFCRTVYFYLIILCLINTISIWCTKEVFTYFIDIKFNNYLIRLFIWILNLISNNEHKIKYCIRSNIDRCVMVWHVNRVMHKNIEMCWQRSLIKNFDDDCLCNSFCCITDIICVTVLSSLSSLWFLLSCTIFSCQQGK